MKPPRTPGPGRAPPDTRDDARDDDLDFAALMLRDDVTPVVTDVRRDASARPRTVPANRGTKPAASRTAPPPRPTAASANRSPGPAAARTVPAARPTAAPVNRSPGPAAARPVVDSAPISGQARDRELAKLLAQQQALTQERDAALLASGSLRAELAALTARHHALEKERDAAIVAIVASITQRSADAATGAALRAELNAARAALHAAQRSPEPARCSLAAALLARGLDGASEQAQALTVLTGGEAASRLLELLEARDPAALASLLERRLALVCGDPGCAPEVGAAALRVTPARCEVCGGSDIQRAAHGFVRACAAAEVVRVRFVGGSPNYRTKLAALFPAGGPLTVHTTAGDKRVSLSRSRSQQRGDDLVIIWGATELDHATSGVYRAEHGRTEVIAHRGIGRMLELAAARLAGAPPGRSLGESRS